MPVVAVIGGGPAGLMAAETLASAGARVVAYERMASVGRKFLLAGRGGLNLTHSEDLEVFLSRYRAPSPLLLDAIRAFPPAELRAWADGLGANTFVGSSGRVFPEGLRATPLLRAWLARLHELGVELRVRHEWQDGNELAADAVVVALGGASWPRTGSDGAWVDRFPATLLRPSNAGFVVEWSEEFRTRFAGTPIKDVALSGGGERSRGDVIVTQDGIEGGAIYGLSARAGHALIHVDLRPDQTLDVLAARLARRRPKESVSSWLRGAGLAPVAISLLREATDNAIPREADDVAGLIKAVPVALGGVQPIARAISTAGGVPFDEVDDHFMLRSRPGMFVAGEMLDWDAPTGGYLLQGCFSTGVAAARGALTWLGAR